MRNLLLSLPFISLYRVMMAAVVGRNMSRMW